MVGGILKQRLPSPQALFISLLYFRLFVYEHMQDLYLHTCVSVARARTFRAMFTVTQPSTGEALKLFLLNVLAKPHT